MGKFRLRVVLPTLLITVLIAVGISGCKKEEPASESPDSKQVQQVRESDLAVQPKTEHPAPKAKRAVEPAETEQQDIPIEEQVQAERLYQMALTESKIAKKPFMTYKRMVNYCRQILQQYPNSSYAAKARELLRKMPERYRKQYNVTDEEIGL